MLQQYSPFELTVFGLILFNVIFSAMAFGNYRRFEQLKFNVGAILNDKEYYRMISSSFIHGSWFHLGINMYVLYMFSGSLSFFTTIPSFLLIFFASMLISHFVSLFVNRHKSYYSAVGASGAVSGVLYASIYFMPNTPLHIIFIPFVEFPAWSFGVLYMIYSIYAAKKNNDNIGHDAHIGGAIAGLIIAFILSPENAFQNWKIILAMMAPVVYYIFTMFQTQDILSNFKRIDKGEVGNYSNRSIDDLYNEGRTLQIRELNELLEKVKENGLDSLSKNEKDRLDFLSQELK